MRRSFLALLFACLVFLGLGIWGGWLCDDAFISFRYARHLAEGQGLMFNLGEALPVEGYSNLLWVLLMAGFEALDVPAPAAAPWLTLGLGLVWVVFASRLLARREGAGLTAWMGALLVLVTLPAAVVWSTSGLETQAFATALLVAFVCLVRATPRPVLGALALAAVLLLRIDGSYYSLLVLGLAVLRPRVVSRRWSARGLWGPLVVLALVACGQLVFRYLYHGSWVPYVAEVKVAPSLVVFARGGRYVLAMLVAMPALFGLVLFAAWRWPRSFAVFHSRQEAEAARAMEFEFLAAGVLLFAVLGLAVLVGGDFMAFGRFLVPGLAFAGLFGVDALARLRPRARGLVAGLAIVTSLASLAGVSFAPAALSPLLDFRHGRARVETERVAWDSMAQNALDWSELGRALNARTSPGESFVCGTVGAVGYYSELFLYDTFGLVDRDVGLAEGHPEHSSPGHDKAVPEMYFFDRSPTYFSFTALVSLADPFAEMPVTFFTDPLMRSLFRVDILPLDGVPGVRPGKALRLVRFLGGVDDALDKLAARGVS
jgi:arabinofuranosyltransferase